MIFGFALGFFEIIQILVRVFLKNRLTELIPRFRGVWVVYVPARVDSHVLEVALYDSVKKQMMDILRILHQ